MPNSTLTSRQKELETRQRMEREKVRRQAARSNLLDFARYTMPVYRVNWHHARMCERLDAFVRGEVKRLMIFQPPQHGKSELVSRRLPAYVFGQRPGAKLVACSYTADLAESMSLDVQRIMDHESYARLFPARACLAVVRARRVQASFTLRALAGSTSAPGSAAALQGDRWTLD